MAKPIKEFEKDPSAVLDYTINWSDWLTAGETISTSTWTLDTGITLSTDSKSTTTATAWISGGEHGRSYLATNQIVTNSTPTRTDERSISLIIREQ